MTTILLLHHVLVCVRSLSLYVHTYLSSSNRTFGNTGGGLGAGPRQTPSDRLREDSSWSCGVFFYRTVKNLERVRLIRSFENTRQIVPPTFSLRCVDLGAVGLFYPHGGAWRDT